MKPKNLFRITLAVVVLTGHGITLLAQETNLSTNRNTLSFEIIGGASLLKNTGYWEDHMSTKFGYSGGIGLSYSLTPTFSISTRGLWELKGSKTYQNHSIWTPNEGDRDLTYHLNTNYNYLTVSVLPTFRVGHSKRIMAGAGAYYSWLQKAGVDLREEDHTNNTTTYNTDDNPDDFHTKYDVGVSMFAGYTFVFVGNSNCSVVIMYNKGVVDIEDAWNDYQRNNSIQLQFIFSIPAVKRHKAL